MEYCTIPPESFAPVSEVWRNSHNWSTTLSSHSQPKFNIIAISNSLFLMIYLWKNLKARVATVVSFLWEIHSLIGRKKWFHCKQNTVTKEERTPDIFRILATSIINYPSKKLIMTFVPTGVLAPRTDTLRWRIAPESLVGQTPKQTGSTGDYRHWN